MKASAVERRDEKAAEVKPASRFRSAYGPRYRVPTLMIGESRTKQSFAAECDVNTIMRRYQQSGVLPGAAERAAGARYMDCTGADYQAAMLLVASAKSQFQELSAELRARFGNDPRKMMEFLEDSRNLEEARELGLARPATKEATPLAVRVVEPSQSDPGKALSRIEGEAGSAEPPKPVGKPKA